MTPTPTAGEMEHFQTLEVELSAWEPFSNLPPQLQSQLSHHSDHGHSTLGRDVPHWSLWSPSGNSGISSDGCGENRPGPLGAVVLQRLCSTLWVAPGGLISAFGADFSLGLKTL